MIMVRFKLVIISVSLIVIIVPNFRTVYGLGVLLEDTGDDNNSASTNWQNSSDSGLEQMVLKAEFKPDENQFLAKDGYYRVQKTTLAPDIYLSCKKCKCWRFSHVT
jgi:hypothetical protein